MVPVEDRSAQEGDTLSVTLTGRFEPAQHGGASEETSAAEAAEEIEENVEITLGARGVLKEFGLELPEHVKIRVWDSTAEVRYLVVPERPAGTEHLSEQQLAALVTRDSMIGVAKAKAP